MAQGTTNNIFAAKQTILLLILFGFLFTNISCNGDYKAFNASIRAALTKVLGDSVVTLGVPGAVMAVRGPNGEEWVGATGVYQSATPPSDNGTEGWQGNPMRDDLYFRIASVTKTFTAVFTMMLVDDGLVTLDDYIEKWLPGAVPNSGQITLKQLLNHSSGVADFSTHPDYSETRVWTHEEILALVNDLSPQFVPGEEHKYCNTNYYLLGMIAEKATGQDWGDLIEKRVVQALGLSHTMVPTDSAFPGEHAYGYEQNRETGAFTDVSVIEPSGPWSAGCIISTPRDLLRWARALLDGELITATSKANMFDFQDSDTSDTKFGLGVFELKGSSQGHTGSIQGFESAVFRHQDHDFAIIVNGRVIDAPFGHTALYIYSEAIKELFGEGL